MNSELILVKYNQGEVNEKFEETKAIEYLLSTSFILENQYNIVVKNLMIVYLNHLNLEYDILLITNKENCLSKVM